MIIEFQKTVRVEFVEGDAIADLPRWLLKDLSLIVGPYNSAGEHEQHFLETVGSGDPFPSADDEFLFHKVGHKMESLILRVPQRSLAGGGLLEGWHDLPSVPGALHLIRATPFEAGPANRRWLDLDGNYLACVNDLILKDAMDYMRLGVAQNLDFLIADRSFCGWMLSNPADYLADGWEKPYHSEPAADLLITLHEFLNLVEERQINRMIQKDRLVLSNLISLRNRTGYIKGDRSPKTVIGNAIEDVIERFYGRQALPG